MEKTKKSNKRRESTDLFNDELLPNNSNSHSTSTPIRTNRSEDEDSPYFPCSTQEMRDDVDVLWDYNSPQSKPKVWRKSKKKLNLQQSPKVPFRRHPSMNNEQIKQDFSKLREELRALRAEIAKPDHEESLVLSPREEESFKSVVDEPHFEDVEEQIDDPFDDDMDDKLVLCSQQVESEFHKIENNYSDIKNIYGQKSLQRLQESEVFNDSFDNVVSQMNESDFDQLTQVVDIKKYKDNKTSINLDKHSKAFPRSLSEDELNFKGVQSLSGKVEWHRTQSFESYAHGQLSKDKIDEIEKKRLQAKAKLEAKKKKVEYSDSPLKCSPEEIEKKRLQALAKLEAKRQSEIIEKKKQEALKRREENRRINAAQVKSSLSTRL